MALAAKFEIEKTGTGYRWVLKSQGRTLAMGESYNRIAMAEKAMATFRVAAATAPVVDKTLPAATPTKVAKATGRALGKAVVTSGRAVEAVEKVAAKAAKRAVKTTADVVETVAGAASGTRGRKAPAKRR